MADFNPDAWLASKTGPEGSEAFDPDQWLAKKGKSGIAKALDTTGRGLDYMAGAVRHAGIGLPANAIQHYAQDVPEADIEKQNASDTARVLVGKGPRTEEYLKRAGVSDARPSDALPDLYTDEKGFTLKPKKGGLLDPSLRGFLGLAGDIATDPITYAAGAVHGLLNPATSAAEGAQTAGRGLYNQAWKEADHAASMAGKTYLPSQAGWEMGINGGGKAMARQTDDALANLMGQRDDLVKMVDQAGAEADIPSALSNVRAKIAEFKASRDDSLINIANKMEPQIDRIEAAASAKPAIPASPGTISTQATNAVPAVPGANLEQTLSNKTSLYNQTGENAYDVLASTTPGQELLKAGSNGLKTESEKMASRAVPGAGEQLGDINERLGALLTPRELIERQATKEVRRMPFTQVDAMALMADPKLYVAKQLGKAMGGSAMKTYGGRALYGAGNAASKVSPLLDLLGRQGMINLGREND